MCNTRSRRSPGHKQLVVVARAKQVVVGMEHGIYVLCGASSRTVHRAALCAFAQLRAVGELEQHTRCPARRIGHDLPIQNRHPTTRRSGALRSGFFSAKIR